MIGGICYVWIASLTVPPGSARHGQGPVMKRILVVDDEPAVTDLLVYNLRKAHYEA